MGITNVSLGTNNESLARARGTSGNERLARARRSEVASIPLNVVSIRQSVFDSRTTNRRVLELVFNLLFRQRLAVYLNVRINQEVNRFPALARLQRQVAAHRERDPVGVEMAEIILTQVRMLPRFRCVHRNPLAAGVKFRPAMIT